LERDTGVIAVEVAVLDQVFDRVDDLDGVSVVGVSYKVYCTGDRPSSRGSLLLGALQAWWAVFSAVVMRAKVTESALRKVVCCLVFGNGN